MIRSHLLRELALPGAESLLRHAPDFDLYNLREVTALKWEVSPGVALEVDPELVLSFRVDGESGVQMRCIGVRRLILPELAPHFWTAEIEIQDLTGSHLEGIRYCVKDYRGDFEVQCRDITLDRVGFR